MSVHFGGRLFAALALFAAASLPALADSPTAAGTWAITFYSDPGRIATATQCVVLTRVPGTVNTEGQSGTWFSTSYPGWGGIWFQEGDHLVINGVTTGHLATTLEGNLNHRNDIGGQSFEGFLVSHEPATNNNAGSWEGVRTNCQGLRNPHPPNADPTRS